MPSKQKFSGTSVALLVASLALGTTYTRILFTALSVHQLSTAAPPSPPQSFELTFDSNDEFNDKHTVVFEFNGSSFEGGFADHFQNYVVQANEDVLLPTGGQSRLCALLRRLTVQEGPSSTTQMINITINCEEVLESSTIDEGDWLLSVYAARLATVYFGVNLQYQCEGPADRLQHVLSWPRKFRKFSHLVIRDLNDLFPRQRKVCSNSLEKVRFDIIVSEIIADMRDMAEAVIGPDEDSPHSEDTGAVALAKGFETDDVVIHLSCQSFNGGVGDSDVGFVPFSAYRKRIEWNVTESIGITVHPGPGGKTEECGLVTKELADYLRHASRRLKKNVEVSVRDYGSESLPLMYTRLIMAKQMFSSCESIGVLPVVATMGKAYVPKQSVLSSIWVLYTDLSHIRVMNEPQLNASAIQGHATMNHTITWLLTKHTTKHKGNSSTI